MNAQKILDNLPSVDGMVYGDDSTCWVGKLLGGESWHMTALTVDRYRQPTNTTNRMDEFDLSYADLLHLSDIFEGLNYSNHDSNAPISVGYNAVVDYLKQLAKEQSQL